MKKINKKVKKHIYPVESPYYVKPKLTITRVRKIGKNSSLVVLKRNECRVCLNICITQNTRKWIPLTNYHNKMICKKREWDRKTSMFKGTDNRNTYIKSIIFIAYRIITEYQMRHNEYDHDFFMKKFERAVKQV